MITFPISNNGVSVNERFFPFGKGEDGDLDIGVNDPLFKNVYTDLILNAAVEDKVVTVTDTTNFTAGDEVLIYQTQVGTGIAAADPSLGKYEYNFIVSKTASTITLLTPLVKAYTSNAGSTAANHKKTQILKVFHYKDMPVGTDLTCPTWNGRTGGILAVRATGFLSGAGDITVVGLGFRGAAGEAAGEGWSGVNSRNDVVATDSGASGGSQFVAGGGGGNKNLGPGVAGPTAIGGLATGFVDADILTNAPMGGGGGGGNTGGYGGGVLLLAIAGFGNFTGGITANGAAPVDPGGAGGGAGGSALILAPSDFAGSLTVAGSSGVNGASVGYTHQARPVKP